MGDEHGNNTIDLGSDRAHITFTDAHLAEVVSEDLLRGSYCWANGLGWLHWDGRRWKRTPDRHVREQVRLWAIESYEICNREAANALRRGERAEATHLESVAKLWRGVCARGRLQALTDLASGILLEDGAIFDQRHDLLNVGNGVVDLRTGKLRAHDPALRFTKLSPVDYDPAAEHRDWKQSLQALPPEVAEYMQLRFGQAATGHRPDDDVVAVCQGSGANGKSTLIAGLAKALGEFYMLVSDRVLLANPGDHPTEMMDLRGIRLAVIEELPEERRVNVQRLKKITDRQINARLIAQNSVTFDVTSSLFVTSNYRPIIEQTDHGTWRRLALVRFPFTFDGAEGDSGLRDRVRRDPAVHQAVLAWLVAGARRWYDRDRAMPAAPAQVIADTAAWRAASDLILGYWQDRLVPDYDSHVLSTELLADFNDWLHPQNLKEWGERAFTERFGNHEEAERHKIEKRKIRRRDGLSRRHPSMVGKDGPEQYHAWLGVRFRRASDQDKHESGTGGTGTSDGSQNELPHARASKQPVPPVPPAADTAASTPIFAQPQPSRGAS
jgi:putative DNA primase/helicase